MRRGLRLVAVIGALVVAASAACPEPAAASGIERVRFDGGRGGYGFYGGGFHGGGFHRGFGVRGFGYRPGFPVYGGYGFHRRRVWCYYHPGACYPYP